MEPRAMLEAPRRRIVQLAGQVRTSALDNALSAAQLMTIQMDERRALTQGGGNAPGALACLSRAECLRLLATRSTGRFAYVARAGVPDIVPVNYSMDGDDVVIRSGPGPKLQAAERHDTVAFEVDDIDEERHTGWSVVMVGRARRLAQAEHDCVIVAPKPWALGPRMHVVRITPVRIDGRRLS